MNILINLLNIKQKHLSDPCYFQRLSQGAAKVAGKVVLEAPRLCEVLLLCLGAGVGGEEPSGSLQNWSL